MADAVTDPTEIAEIRKSRFRILVCVDGSGDPIEGCVMPRGSAQVKMPILSFSMSGPLTRD